MKFSCDRCHKRFSTHDAPVPGRVYRIPCRCGHTIVLQFDASGNALPQPGSRRVPPPVPPMPRWLPRWRTSPVPRAVQTSPAIASGAHPPGGAAEGAHATRAEAAPGSISADPFARGAPPSLDPEPAPAPTPVRPTPAGPGPVLACRDPDAAADASLEHAAVPPEDAFGDELRRTRTHAFLAGALAGAGASTVCAIAVAVILSRVAAPHPPRVARPDLYASGAPGAVGAPPAELAPAPPSRAAARGSAARARSHAPGGSRAAERVAARHPAAAARPADGAAIVPASASSPAEPGLLERATDPVDRTHPIQLTPGDPPGTTTPVEDRAAEEPAASPASPTPSASDSEGRDEARTVTRAPGPPEDE